jgi:acetyl-CoA carboxylase carboxyl transferase subunit beta
MGTIFDKKRKTLFSMKRYRYENSVQSKDAKPAGENCPKCQKYFSRDILYRNAYVCPHCGHHLTIDGYTRLSLLLDEGSFKEKNKGYMTSDPLNFPGYQKKLKDAKTKSGMDDALITGIGRIEGRRMIVAVLDSGFMMGSMGTVVGEKLTFAIEEAQRKKLPLLIFSASGGARMQEGLYSLMQMAKTSAAIARFSEAGGLYISYLTHPTTGGVSASFASLGDLILAEPNALIGFAGQRVIEQTIGQKLPEGFQRAEYLEDHGFVDRIVDRRQMKKTISQILRLHDGNSVNSNSSRKADR